MSVSQILSEEYGTACRPGGPKVSCPECGDKTFSITKNDCFGRCWIPSCDFSLRTSFISEGGESVISELDDIHHDMLLFWSKPDDDNQTNSFYWDNSPEAQQKRIFSKEAYDWCVNTRGIAPSVLKSQMVGVVSNLEYFTEKFALVIKIAKQTVAEEQGESKKPGRPPKKDSESPAERKLRILEETDEKFKKSAYEGWFALFYTDANGRILSIKFRKPHTKELRHYKPYERSGLFGTHMQHPTLDDSTSIFRNTIIIVEGEFNYLTLQSLCSGFCGLINAYAVGGVSSVDKETFRALPSSWDVIVCYDNDASDSGFMLVKNLSEIRAIHATTTPGHNSDLDSYIRGFVEDKQGAFNAVLKLLEQKAYIHRPLDIVKAEVDQIRRKESKTLKTFEVNRQVASLIISDLKDKGKFYHNLNTSYYFDNEQNSLLTISLEEPKLARMLFQYGISPSEALYKQVITQIALYAIENGAHTEIHTFAYYNQTSNSLYIYNHENSIYKITSDSIEALKNGTESILFLHNEKCTPFTFIPGNRMNGSILDKFLIDPISFKASVLTIEDHKTLFRYWLLSLFFPQLFPTRPILAMIGEKGSGKSSAIRRPGQVLMGHRFNVMPLTKDSKDFDAAVTNNFLVAIDNADTKNSWLDDKLAVCATGGTITKRILHTTNTIGEFPISASIAITSRTPNFQRDDVADRLLIFHVSRIKNFRAESELKQELEENRDQIMTDIIYTLQDILRAFENQAGKSYHTNFRIADFANFSLKIAHFQGQAEPVEALFRKLSQEQSVFTLSDNPIAEIIQAWLDLEGGKNIGRKLSVTEFCQELNDLAQRLEIDFYQNPNAFSQKWGKGGLMNTLQSIFKISMDEVGGRKKLIWLENRERCEG